MDAMAESKIFFRGFMVSRIQRPLFICLHHSQSQEVPSNAMARAASATAGGIFSWGAPRRWGLWRPWPGEEEHLQLAQLEQDRGHPAGEVQAVLPAIHLPPAAGGAVCSESSLSLDLTGPLWQKSKTQTVTKLKLWQNPKFDYSKRLRNWISSG